MKWEIGGNMCKTKNWRYQIWKWERAQKGMDR